MAAASSSGSSEKSCERNGSQGRVRCARAPSGEHGREEMMARMATTGLGRSHRSQAFLSALASGTSAGLAGHPYTLKSVGHKYVLLTLFTHSVTDGGLAVLRRRRAGGGDGRGGGRCARLAAGSPGWAQGGGTNGGPPTLCDKKGSPAKEGACGEGHCRRGGGGVGCRKREGEGAEASNECKECSLSLSPCRARPRPPHGPASTFLGAQHAPHTAPPSYPPPSSPGAR